MKNILLLFAAFSFVFQSNAQTYEEDSIMLRRIYDDALINSAAYDWLDHLTNQIGGRLSGSPEAAQAVEWAKQVMDTMGLDSVWLQPVMVPHWVRGEKEYAIITTDGRGTHEVNVCALGGSVGTGNAGITAEIIEVADWQELQELEESKVKGKIVFYNTPMEPKHIQTFHSYGHCVQYRWAGATQAAQLGAVGVLVRSLSHKIDEFPHTGSMGYGDDTTVPKIPAAAISTLHAEQLSRLLKSEEDLRFHYRMTCKTLPDKLSYNVIGEIFGTEYPEEIILVGGHLDSWDNGDGAHDDGAGCVQSMQVLRTFKELGIAPKRTIRVVLFMNEENGTRGAKKYAEEVGRKGENHVVAIESDAGGFTPRGFRVNDTSTVVKELQNYLPLFKPYLIHHIEEGFSGVDIRPLKEHGTITIGFMPDSQRYFDYHHAPTDTFDAVNKRELELGAATMTALIYLLQENGIPQREKTN